MRAYTTLTLNITDNKAVTVPNVLSVKTIALKAVRAAKSVLLTAAKQC
jgi:hypothetical protein